jgi:hypothetical protein
MGPHNCLRPQLSYFFSNNRLTTVVLPHFDREVHSSQALILFSSFREGGHVPPPDSTHVKEACNKIAFCFDFKETSMIVPVLN